MIARLQKKYALSRQGAMDLIKGCAACVFQKGHQIELVIRNQDDLRSRMAMNGSYRLPFMRSVRHEIHFGQSHLLLPLIPKDK